jgi:WhiB family redox-sensing transcriptional regulator
VTATLPTPLESPSTDWSKFARLLYLYLPDLSGALCKDADPTLWFGPHVCDEWCDGERGCIAGKSEQGRFARIQAAKQVCAVCPVKAECGEWAIQTDQDFGIWGGMTERERKKIRKERRD